MSASHDACNNNRSKKVCEIDRDIGKRLRMWRRTMNVDAKKLASKIGITYQQLQKYEKGLTRISATRLFIIANELDVPVAYFYHDLNDSPDMPPPPNSPDHGTQPHDAHAAVMGMLLSQDSTKLMRDYSAIKNDGIRRALHNLMQSIAEVVQ